MILFAGHVVNLYAAALMKWNWLMSAGEVLLCSGTAPWLVALWPGLGSGR